MRSRIEELGITEALVQRQGDHRIRIELPGVQDPGAKRHWCWQRGPAFLR